MSVWRAGMIVGGEDEDDAQSEEGEYEDVE